MRFTSQQKKLFDLYPVKVFRHDIYPEIGYTFKGETSYEIHVNDKVELWELVLIHELAHVKLGHLDVDFEEYEEIVKEVAEKRGVHIIPTHHLINIAMDLEVNSKYFTIFNRKELEGTYYRPVFRDDPGIDLPYYEDWRGYLKALLEKQDLEELDNIIIQVKDFLLGQGVDKPKGGKGEDLSNVKGEFLGDNKEEEQESEEVTGTRLGAGTSRAKSELKSSKEDSEKVDKIVEFLSRIFSIKRELHLDSIKNYNRGTRGRGNILYTSHSRKIRKDQGRIMIVIDVSPSMDVEMIVTAIQACVKIAQENKIDARIVHWAIDKVQEYDIYDIPKCRLRGSGTCIFSSLEYAESEGFRKVVIYSDMDSIDTLSKCKKEGMWVASISTRPSELSESQLNDVKKNSDMLLEL